MGNLFSIRTTDLSEEEIEDISTRTGLNLVQIELLYNRFKRLVPNHETQVLTRSDFENITELNSNPLGYRIIDVIFRLSPSDTIDFYTFVSVMAIFQVIPPKLPDITRERIYLEKLDFIFRMFDVDNDGIISKSDLREIVDKLIEPSERTTLQKENKLDEKINEIVDKVMKEVNKGKSNVITLETYKETIVRDDFEMRMSLPLLCRLE